MYDTAVHLYKLKREINFVSSEIESWEKKKCNAIMLAYSVDNPRSLLFTYILFLLVTGSFPCIMVHNI